jgi:hypothetical protein
MRISSNNFQPDIICQCGRSKVRYHRSPLVMCGHSGFPEVGQRMQSVLRVSGAHAVQCKEGWEFTNLLVPAYLGMLESPVVTFNQLRPIFSISPFRGASFYFASRRAQTSFTLSNNPEGIGGITHSKRLLFGLFGAISLGSCFYLSAYTLTFGLIRNREEPYFGGPRHCGQSSGSSVTVPRLLGHILAGHVSARILRLQAPSVHFHFHKDHSTALLM